jgi:17 kDa outer membrane surface antigen
MSDLSGCRPWRTGGPASSRDRRRRVALPVAIGCILLALPAPRVAAQADADEDYVGPLISEALETQRSGVELPWTNPATGGSGIIVVERTFYRDPRTPCRDYRRTLERGGRPTVTIEGTGCRTGSGRWSLDEEASREARTRSAPLEPEPAEPPAPEPAAGPPSCPPPSAAPAACEPPSAGVDYTLPPKTEL